MPSSPIAESESRNARNFSTFSGEKDRVQEQLGATVYGGCKEGGVRDTTFGRKHRIEAFSLLMSRVSCGAI